MSKPELRESSEVQRQTEAVLYTELSEFLAVDRLIIERKRKFDWA